MTVNLDDLEILDAIRRFALEHDHPAVAPFKDAMRDWGDDWISTGSDYHQAADFLDSAARLAESHELVARFALHKHRLRWEQSYTREDGLVPDAMLDGYAFAEIIGKHGPFVSTRIRAGLGVWGPGIDYPRHQHAAEEVYIPLAGAAEFSIGDAPAARQSVGDVVFVPSNTPHGFRTGDELLVVYYLWRAGDLRQKSSFF